MADWFRNRRAEAAEAAAERITQLWKDHVATVEKLYTQMHGEAVRELADLKNAHAAELNRVIEDNQRLRDDVKRLQLLAIPALKNVELEPDKTPPPSPSEVYGGTPWQRVLAREIAAQEKQARDRLTRPLVPAEGVNDGSNGEGRDEAPLGEQGKPA